MHVSAFSFFFNVTKNEDGTIKEIFMATKKGYSITIHAFTFNKEFNFCPSKTEIDPRTGIKTHYLNLSTYINFSTVTRDLIGYEVDQCESETELLNKFSEKVSKLKALYYYNEEDLNIVKDCLDLTILSRRVTKFNLKKFIEQKYYLCSYDSKDVVMMFLNKKNRTEVETCITCAELLNVI